MTKMSEQTPEEGAGLKLQQPGSKQEERRPKENAGRS